MILIEVNDPNPTKRSEQKVSEPRNKFKLKKKRSKLVCKVKVKSRTNPNPCTCRVKKKIYQALMSPSWKRTFIPMLLPS